MVEIVDIKDAGSLEAWLQEQPREVSGWIALRAALRVFPFYWQWAVSLEAAKEPDLTALPMLRFSLTSEVARKMSTYEIIADAARTAAAVRAASRIVDGRATYANAAANAAATATYATIDNAAADAANAAAEVATTAAYATIDNAGRAPTDYANIAVWVSIRADCDAIATSADLDHLPLWAGGDNPLAQEWRDLKQHLTVSNPARSDESARGAVAVDWSFWIKWYDAVLAGTPLNWDMLEEIALIEGEEWEKGPARVNFLIGEIEQDYARKATPNAEDIIVNEDGKYQAVPRSAIPAQTLRDANGRIGDVILFIRDAQKGNQYSALLPEADLLEDIQTRYGDNALRLFEVCSKVVSHVGRHVVNGVLPESDNVVGDVIGDLQNTADDIYSFDAEAKAAIDARAKLRFERLTDEQKAKAVHLAEAVAKNSVEGMAQEMREDAKVVQGEVEPMGETKANRYRLGSRLVRVLALGGAGLKKVYKTLGFVGTIGGGASVLWMVAKFLIGF